MKLILYFLKMLQQRLEHGNNEEVSEELWHLLNRKDLLEILRWMYQEKDHDEKSWTEMTEPQLAQAIADERIILEYYIQYLHDAIVARPTFSEEERDTFFSKFMVLRAHYLASKPMNQWDSYDLSNYRALLYKHGKLVKTFVIARDIEDGMEVYKPDDASYYFDTYDEAIDALDELHQTEFEQASGFEVKEFNRWKY